MKNCRPYFRGRWVVMNKKGVKIFTFSSIVVFLLSFSSVNNNFGQLFRLNSSGEICYGSHDSQIILILSIRGRNFSFLE
jgi:hypothetical protein